VCFRGQGAAHVIDTWHNGTERGRAPVRDVWRPTVISEGIGFKSSVVWELKIGEISGDRLWTFGRERKRLF